MKKNTTCKLVLVREVLRASLTVLPDVHLQDVRGGILQNSLRITCTGKCQTTEN
jgi:hypothetical protein